MIDEIYLELVRGPLRLMLNVQSLSSKNSKVYVPYITDLLLIIIMARYRRIFTDISIKLKAKILLTNKRNNVTKQKWL